MRAFETEKTEIAEVDRSVYDIKDKVNAAFEVNSGLTAEIVEKISEEKHDPEWMREFRLKALDTYNRMSLPTWGPSLEGLDMSNIVTYVRPNTEMRGKWSEVPDDIKNTFERLGIPQAERSSLAGAVFAGLIRILKYLAFLLAVFGPGLYVMAVAFAPEIIPIQLLTKLARGEAATPLPPMLEMLCVTLLLEIVREAGLRAPQSISHTVSLVGALIIGETAVSAGIVSVPVLTMAAAATIATLAVPSLYEQSILFRFAVILLAGCFGVPGLACAALTILAMACGSEPFGYDYLYPLLPLGRASVRDGFVRSIWSRLARSGEVIGQHEA